MQTNAAHRRRTCGSGAPSRFSGVLRRHASKIPCRASFLRHDAPRPLQHFVGEPREVYAVTGPRGLRVVVRELLTDAEEPVSLSQADWLSGSDSLPSPVLVEYFVLDFSATASTARSLGVTHSCPHRWHFVASVPGC